MDVTGVVVLGIILFFGIVLLTLLFGAFGKKNEREIQRRNAEDRATGGGMTLPPSPRDNPV
jgi:hypothetical protein